MIAAVRVRGVPDARRNARETMETLHLHNKNNCVLLPDTETYHGMLHAVKDYVAYGDVSADAVEQLLAEHGSIDGEPLPDAVDATGFDDVAALSAALVEEETTVFDLREAGLQLPFRLSPPAKGFRDTKRHHRQGGSLGKRDDMDALLARMI